MSNKPPCHGYTRRDGNPLCLHPSQLVDLKICSRGTLLLMLGTCCKIRCLTEKSLQAPEKLRWDLKMDHRKRRFPFWKPTIFRFRVSFWGVGIVSYLFDNLQIVWGSNQQFQLRLVAGYFTSSVSVADTQSILLLVHVLFTYQTDQYWVMFTSYTLENYHGSLKIAIIFERRYIFQTKPSFSGISCDFFSLYMSVMCHVSHLSRSDRRLHFYPLGYRVKGEVGVTMAGHHGWLWWWKQHVCLCFFFGGGDDFGDAFFYFSVWIWIFCFCWNWVDFWA